MVQSNCAALLGCFVGLAAACREPPSSEPERARPAETARTATASASAAASAPLFRAARPSATDGGSREARERSPAWSRCAEGFHPRSTPEVDALRLGMLCGPENGMLRWGPALTGEIGEDGRDGQHTVRAEAGSCVRFAVVVGEGVEDLEVELGPKGAAAEPVVLERRWALVPEAEPLCVSKTTALSLTLRAHDGTAPYVVTGWKLR